LILQWWWIGGHFSNRGNTRECPHALQELARQCVLPLQ
jgi:hypothetical protein